MIEVKIEKLADELGVEVTDLQMLFVEYCGEMRSEIAEVRNAAETADWNILQRTAHNIKGVSINLGIMEMHKQAEVIDLMMKTGAYDGIELEVKKLENTFVDTEAAIKSAFRKHDMEI